MHPEAEQSQKALNELSNRLLLMESKLASLNDKLDSTRQILDRMNAKTTDSEVMNAPSANAGETIQALATPEDPEGGFINDKSVQTFRKGMILYLGQKYPESVLAFSGFLEEFPDHPLAGTAQFYIGEAYSSKRSSSSRCRNTNASSLLTIEAPILPTPSWK